MLISFSRVCLTPTSQIISDDLWQEQEALIPVDSGRNDPGLSRNLMEQAASTACQTMFASCQATLTSKIEAAQQDVGLRRQGMDKIWSRVSEAEQRVGQVEDTSLEHATALCKPKSAPWSIKPRTRMDAIICGLWSWRRVPRDAILWSP